MGALRIPVVKIGGGYLKAILRNGQECVFGRDEKELEGEAEASRGRVARASQRSELALDVAGRK